MDVSIVNVGDVDIELAARRQLVDVDIELAIMI